MYNTSTIIIILQVLQSKQTIFHYCIFHSSKNYNYYIYIKNNFFYLTQLSIMSDIVLA